MRELALFKKKHYTEIDHLYTIGVVLVILGHSHSSDWDTFSGTILETALEFLYTFHMPLFFGTIRGSDVSEKASASPPKTRKNHESRCSTIKLTAKHTASDTA